MLGSHSFDPTLAQTNIDKEIENLHARLEQLQTSRKLLKTNSKEILAALDVLQKFGRNKPGKKLKGEALNRLAPIRPNVLAALAQTNKPMRAGDILDVFMASGITRFKLPQIKSALDGLNVRKAVTRLAKGLYTSANGNGKNGSSVAEGAAKLAGGVRRQKGSRASKAETIAAYAALVDSIVQNAEAPIARPKILEIVNQTYPEMTEDQASRALAKNPNLKRHGTGRWVTWTHKEKG